MPSTALRVGLVGAGTWAARVHAPMLAAGPETRLTGVWSRRRGPAAALAEAHGTTAMDSFGALLEGCEAVAFAVPPDVQVALALEAVRAGRHVLLEKPLALTLADARRLADAVTAAGVVSQLMLSYRYRPETAAFLDQARAFAARGARAAFLSSALLEGPYADTWRRAHGAVLDLGPHVLDLLDGALGPITAVVARGDPRHWTSLLCTHAGGVVSTVDLSLSVRLQASVFKVELFGAAGELTFDGRALTSESPWPTVRRTFAAAVRGGRSTAIDVHRGVMLQALIEQAHASLA